MYLADRTNHAIAVIDTHTNTVVGQMPLAATTVVNQPLIAIDLQQLAVSDGLNSVLVWDLRTPLGTAPAVYNVPGVPDGMDYDTINQTVYVVNDNAPYFLTGISLAKKMIVSQTVIPFSADLIKFNPRDGKVYIAMEDADHNNASAGIAVFDPATGTMSTPAMYKVGSICPGHGIDIDPVSNVAVMGCFQGTSNGNLGIDLATGKFIQFTDVGGTDSIVLNPNLRRFYSGSGLNTATTSGCPATPNAPPFGSLVPVVGVFDAKHPSGNAPARLDGVACTGRGNHIAGWIRSQARSTFPSRSFRPTRPAPQRERPAYWCSKIQRGRRRIPAENPPPTLAAAEPHREPCAPDPMAGAAHACRLRFRASQDHGITDGVHHGDHRGGSLCRRGHKCQLR